MGKKVVKLFMETMLRAAVIILGIGIVIMVALLIKTVSANKKQLADKKNTTNSDIVTEAEDPDDPTFNKDAGSSDGDNVEADGTVGDIKNAKVLVINATGKGGVAGSWRDTLQGEGYTSVEVGNYLSGTLSTTKVCVSGGYDATSLAEKFTSPEMSTIDSLDASAFDMTIGDYDIVVVIGSTDASH